MRITWSVFPKFDRELSVQSLAEHIRRVGLDTTNVVIRDGYWVTRDHMKSELPAFVRVMADAGLEVRFATAGFTSHEVLEDESLLAILKESGINEFRMGYFRWDKSLTPAECLEDARRELAAMIPLCAKHGVRAVYQVHHNTLIPSAWAAWSLVHDLPPKQIGVMLDPGNQLNEGWERWQPACHLLGDHLVAMGIKDGVRPNRTAKLEWAPCQDGSIDWAEVGQALLSVDFSGTFVFMPFYDRNDFNTRAVRLKTEVEYIRKVIDDAKESANG